jgi:hypothetical protein
VDELMIAKPMRNSGLLAKGGWLRSATNGRPVIGGQEDTQSAVEMQ